jgi:deoxyuridine 5'-triphosphate nucleotidohydrolase
MTIPIRVKLLTKTAKAPEQSNEGDLLDLFADGFCSNALKDVVSDEVDKATTYDVDNGNAYEINSFIHEGKAIIQPRGRILVKTGISLELPIKYKIAERHSFNSIRKLDDRGENIFKEWLFDKEKFFEERDKIIGQYCWNIKYNLSIQKYAVADLRPRSGLALKHGITVLNAPATIDNSYRKEIGVILINHGHQPYTIRKGDKIAQMLIRPLYPNKMEIVENIEDSSRGGYGSTGKK